MFGISREEFTSSSRGIFGRGGFTSVETTKAVATPIGVGMVLGMMGGFKVANGLGVALLFSNAICCGLFGLFGLFGLDGLPELPGPLSASPFEAK